MCHTLYYFKRDSTKRKIYRYNIASLTDGV